jgi:preprotein translocase subunit SecA
MGMAGMLMKKEDLENLELTQKQFTSSIEKAQIQMEAWHFGIRKHLFDYDSVVDKQRKRIYAKRDRIIESEMEDDLKTEFVTDTKKDLINNIALIVSLKIEEAKTMKQTNIEFLETFAKEFNIKLDKKTADKWENLSFNDLELELTKTLTKHLES